MAGGRDVTTAHELRALAHPLAVGSLVLLALNDHVLKQAWPGWVTGKLSDLAGLVVAPLVLAVALAVTGVRRPHVLAVRSLVGVNRAACLPNRPATRSSSSRTVGSSP